MLRVETPQERMAAVDRLTRREGETYEDFVERAGSDPVARTVKLADLADNMDLARIRKPGPRDRARLSKYRRARKRLAEVIRTLHKKSLWITRAAPRAR